MVGKHKRTREQSSPNIKLKGEEASPDDIQWWWGLPPDDYGEIIDRLKDPDHGILRILDYLVTSLAFQKFSEEEWRQIVEEVQKVSGTKPSITDPAIKGWIAEYIFPQMEKVWMFWDSVRNEFSPRSSWKR